MWTRKTTFGPSHWETVFSSNELSFPSRRSFLSRPLHTNRSVPISNARPWCCTSGPRTNDARLAGRSSFRSRGLKSSRTQLLAQSSRKLNFDQQELVSEVVPSQSHSTAAAQRNHPHDSSALQAGLGSAHKSGRSSLWGRVDGKKKVLLASCMAFVLCNMDKVNMSIAIIPMAHDFGWNASVSGLVQSSFFYGYMLCQIPGGLLSSAFTGSRMLPIGVGVWSTATMLLPSMGSSILGLSISRAMVGLGEALSPCAATDMVARAAPPGERARATSIVFGGLNMGTIIGLLLSPALVQSLGWESVFYVFGGLGILWVVFFQSTLKDVEETDPEFISALRNKSIRGMEKVRNEKLPWRAILRCRPLRALMFTHFCNNWFHYTMLAWLPSYFVDSLSLDLASASHMSLIPPVAAFITSVIAGPFADHLISRGWKISHVRKLAQSIAFLGPMICLGGATLSNDDLVDLICITLALGLSSFSLAGLYCNHQDLSRKYASVLLGITNTVGAIPGIAGITVAGYLFDTTGSWSVSLFLPSMTLFVAGTVVFTLYGSGEAQDLSNNTPFEIEIKLRRMVKIGLVSMRKNWYGKFLAQLFG